MPRIQLGSCIGRLKNRSKSEGAYNGTDVIKRSRMVDPHETSIPATRIYRVSWLQRPVALGIFAVWSFFSIAIWVAVLRGDRDPSFYELFGVLCCTLFVGFFVVRAFRSSVSLTETAIVLSSLSGTRILPYDKIRGRRRYYEPGDADSPGSWHLRFESTDDRYPSLEMDEIYNFDEEFRRWFNSLPDLDQLRRAGPKPSNFGLV